MTELEMLDRIREAEATARLALREARESAKEFRDGLVAILKELTEVCEEIRRRADEGEEWKQGQSDDDS